MTKVLVRSNRTSGIRGLLVTGLLVPVSVLSEVSIAVKVQRPTVFNVVPRRPRPWEKDTLRAPTCGSVLETRAVPA